MNWKGVGCRASEIDKKPLQYLPQGPPVGASKPVRSSGMNVLPKKDSNYNGHQSEIEKEKCDSYKLSSLCEVWETEKGTKRRQLTKP